MDNTKKSENKNPRNGANIVSQIFFLWLFPLLWKGFRTGLTTDDLTVSLDKDLSKQLGDKLERQWQRTLEKSGTKKCDKKMLRRVIFLTFYKSIIINGLLGFLIVLIRILSTFVFTQLLLNYQSPLLLEFNFNITNLNITNSTNSNTTQTTDEHFLDQRPSAIALHFQHIWNDKLYLSGIFIALLSCYSIAFQHIDLRQRMVGARIRIACCSLIYRKTLRLSTKSTSGSDGDTGNLINLLSNDVNRLDIGLIYIHYIWIVPIVSILISYILWEIIGVAGLTGVGTLLLLTLPMQSMVTRLSAKLRGKIAQRSSKRIGLINEIIQGIQVIKMYAWENSFIQLVNGLRKNELKFVRSVSFIRGIIAAGVLFSGRVALFSTIITMVLLNINLSGHTVFSAAQHLYYLQTLANTFFTLGLMFRAEAFVAIDRIQQFLLLEESKNRENTAGYTQIQLHSSLNMNLLNLNSIEIMNVTGGWNLSSSSSLGNDSEHFMLKNILLNIKAGQLCAIVGSVGSGKTSLLNLLLGELQIITGNCLVKGTISYASQEPWLFSDTIKNNILFGETFDQQRYNEVIEYSDLHKDFKQLPFGDDTVVGEKGISLSGGQRSRINLARAIYKTADIYLFDDPLSAVDVHVGKILFHEIIETNGFLAKKDEQQSTRILVTHQVHFLQSADVIAVIDNGKIIHMGKYSEISWDSQDKFIQLVQSNMNDNDIQSNVDNMIISEPEANDNDETISLLNVKFNKQNASINGINMKSNNNKIQSDDNREQLKQGNVSINVWKEYFRAGANIRVLFLLLILIIFTQSLVSVTDYFLSYWTSQEYLRQHADNLVSYEKYEYAYIFSTLIVAVIITTIVRAFFFYTIVMHSAENLHKNMITKLLNTHMQFFNINPLGRILNRFSKDMGVIDEIIPRMLFDTLQITFVTFGVLIIVIWLNPIIILILTIIIIIYMVIFRFILKPSQNLKRLEGINKSLVFSYVTTTFSGLITIRASGIQSKLIEEFDNIQNVHSASWQLASTSVTCLGVWLDSLMQVFIAAVTFSFVFMDDTNSGNVGLAITQTVLLLGAVQYGFKLIAEVTQQMISTERILEYTNIEQENSIVKKPSVQWPESGKIEFKNVSIKYDENKPAILKHIHFVVQPMWTVGIVGRTGAGKSSIINALLRLAKFNEGIIMIDDIDIATISLESLRLKISIIPQDPFLFSATIRFNLDPLTVYDDHQLWQVLENVELKESISSLDNLITEGGKNFSVGQRQLMCLARALLRQNKILILDEATANVDPQTDALIQRTIRTKFSQCTILMIAHRLHTVIDCDRLIVMDNGEMKEYDIPYLLLQDKRSLLWDMINATGVQETDKLNRIAYEKYKLLNMI